MISPATIEAVAEATTLSDLAKVYFPVRRRGGQFWGCCPFHNEKTASFSINDDKGLWKCWGCGKGGNVFRFVMEMERLSFPEAVEFLAARAGLPIEHEDNGRDGRRDIFGALDACNSLFQAELARSPEARAVLRSRGFDWGICKAWDVGFAPSSYVLPGTGEAMVASGMAYDNGSIRFKDRITFGIRGESGALCGFSGRTMVNHPAKYLNSPETLVFAKGKLLYGLNKAKKAILDKGFAVIVEGQIDTIKCHLAGLDNTIAPLGTGFTTHHCQTVKRLCSQAVLVFDGDKAGREAARKAFAGLSSYGVEVRAVFLPEGQDPDSFMEAKCDLKKAVAEAKSYTEALLESLPLETTEDREAALQKVGFALSCLPDGISRDESATNLAKKMGVKPSVLKKHVAMGGGHMLIPTESGALSQVSEAEKELLVHLMQCGKDKAKLYNWDLVGNQAITTVLGWDYVAGDTSSLAPLLAHLGPEIESGVTGMLGTIDCDALDIKAIYKSMLEGEMRRVAAEVSAGSKDVVALYPYLDTLKGL